MKFVAIISNEVFLFVNFDLGLKVKIAKSRLEKQNQIKFSIQVKELNGRRITK